MKKKPSTSTKKKKKLKNWKCIASLDKSILFPKLSCKYTKRINEVFNKVTKYFS